MSASLSREAPTNDMTFAPTAIVQTRCAPTTDRGGLLSLQGDLQPQGRLTSVRHTLCDVRKTAGRSVGDWVRDAVFYGLCMILVPTHAIEALDADRGTLSRVAHALLASVLAGLLIYSIVTLARRRSVARDEL